MAETKDIDVKAVTAGEEELPAFYRTGFVSFMKEAQKRDPNYRHKWVNKSAQNQHLKLLKGFEPLEDKTEIARIGLTSLTQNSPSGRARWGDLELWRMPERRALTIRKHISNITAERSQSARAAMENIVADTKDRSHGKVAPFMGNDPKGTQDLVEKRQVADVTATK